jgi:DinB family protein
MERQELLDREASSWAAFMAAVERVPVARRAEPGVVPGWSVADLVWHCGYWVDDAARRIEAIEAGTPEPEDPESVWQVTNDEVAERSKTMSWEEVVTRSEAARERIRTVLSSLSEIPAAAESEFVEETFGHYDEHAAEIDRFASASPPDA